MAGRPLKYGTPEELQTLIDGYFNSTPIGDVTITGLAIHLNTSRETLINYEARDEFFDTIKKAKDRVEHAYEMRGLKVGNAFDIFRLKNMGWKDKQEVESSGSLAITWNEQLTDEAQHKAE